MSARRDSLVWGFEDPADASECVRALIEWSNPTREAFAVRFNAEESAHEVHASDGATHDAQTFAIAFAYARNGESVMMSPHANPIPRSGAIEAARRAALAFARGEACTARDAATLARYVLGLSVDGTAGDILAALPTEASSASNRVDADADDPNGEACPAAPEASRVASIEFDADEDPFFECIACGLRSFLSEADAVALETGEPSTSLACAHCGAEHDTIET